MRKKRQRGHARLIKDIKNSVVNNSCKKKAKKTAHQSSTISEDTIAPYKNVPCNSLPEYLDPKNISYQFLGFLYNPPHDKPTYWS